MSFFIATLYLCAAAAMFYVLYFRLTPMRLVLVVLAILLAIEEQRWFMPLIVDDMSNWPVHSITTFFAAAWIGIQGETTLGNLAVVAIGRLIALLSVFYGAVLWIKCGSRMASAINNLPLPRLTLLVIWASCAVLSFSVQVFTPSMFPEIAAVTRLGAALACVAYAGYDVVNFIQQQPVSLAAVWMKVKKRLAELQSNS